ncbi:hypothetical protein [Paraburkholderia humisilvae]|uniref:Uncharacterized protein n=1 Tax=Paraburkholderia humisilvae TaxID=627669 RepID=A0A6J5F8U4_9BURK|nr:hypothetical protein LMG29542_07639 [Paraburkholderia humisilvae]
MQLITPEQLVAVMELAPVPYWLAWLEALVRDGLPKLAPAAVVQHIATDADMPSCAARPDHPRGNLQASPRLPYYR